MTVHDDAVLRHDEGEGAGARRDVVGQAGRHVDPPHGPP